MALHSSISPSFLVWDTTIAGYHHCRLRSDPAAVLRCFWTARGSGCGLTALPRPNLGRVVVMLILVVVLGAGMGGASVIDGGRILALRHGDRHTHAHVVGRGRRAYSLNDWDKRDMSLFSSLRAVGGMVLMGEGGGLSKFMELVRSMGLLLTQCDIVLPLIRVVLVLKETSELL